MLQPMLTNKREWIQDFFSGWALFLISVPVCIGIAQAFGVSAYAGLISGVIGGIVVGMISGSQTSVSGPSAGLTAIILAEMASLRGFEAFLFALLLAGVLQILLGILRVGDAADFLPSSVVRGLICAVGIILILKQIPHLLGHDTDPIGEMSFWQPDRETTFSEFFKISGDLHFSAVAIGMVSLAILAFWEFSRISSLKLVPAPIVVVIVGCVLGSILRRYDVGWGVEDWHFLSVPEAGNEKDSTVSVFTLPDFGQWNNLSIYSAALVIAMVASLEALLNLDAVDQLDPKRRHSPASRELIAQGVGNCLAGLLGGLPVTSRVVHSQININSGGQTRRATIVHGVLFLFFLIFLPPYLNLIPLASIAAILLWTGAKMASPATFYRMWREGKYQFLPFLLTVLSILFTEKLIGAVIGLTVVVAFILKSNHKRPMRTIIEKHLSGELVRLELGNQVSFLNRGTLERTLRDVKPNTHFMIDATNTDYIDPDILSLIRDFKDSTAPRYNIEVSLRGFKQEYSLNDDARFVDYSTRELQQDIKPIEVLRILQEGNRRFKNGEPLFRDYSRQLHSAAQGQFPFAAILSCIDSRAPVETILDLGLGDIFSIRIAGNVVGPKVLGSLEYSCSVGGSKLIVVLGHTKCGAVSASVKFASSGMAAEQATGCKHLEAIVDRIQESMHTDMYPDLANMNDEQLSRVVDCVTRDNVLHSIEQIVTESETLGELARQGKIGIIGALYDISSGHIEFLEQQAIGLQLSAS